MAIKRFKVSDDEMKRNTLPMMASENFDLELLEEHLRGKSIKVLSGERYISQGDVGLKIKVTMKAISAFIGEQDVPEAMFRDPGKYRVYWVNSIGHFKTLRHIRNPHSQFSVFLMFFKKCSLSERIRMFEELESYLNDEETRTT